MHPCYGSLPPRTDERLPWLQVCVPPTLDYVCAMYICDLLCSCQESWAARTHIITDQWSWRFISVCRADQDAAFPLSGTVMPLIMVFILVHARLALFHLKLVFDTPICTWDLSASRSKHCLSCNPVIELFSWGQLWSGHAWEDNIRHESSHASPLS